MMGSNTVNSEVDKKSLAFMKRILEEDTRVTVIALTGKINAGVSDVKKMLVSNDIKMLTVPPKNEPAISARTEREMRIIDDFLAEKWRPFIEISAVAVMVSFLLEADIKDIEDTTEIKGSRGRIKRLFPKLKEIIKPEGSENFLKFIEKVIDNLKNLYFVLNKYYSADTKHYRYFEMLSLKKPDELREYIRSNDVEGKYKIFLDELTSVEKLRAYWNEIKGNLGNRGDEKDELIWFCFGVLPAVTELLKDQLPKESIDSDFTITFQDIGNNIRAYGKVLPEEGAELSALSPEQLFALPERINSFIKLLRYHKRTDTPNSINVVINCLKNMFEAYYFRKRYPSFYLLAVSCEENQRRSRVGDRFDEADLRENLSRATKIYNAYKEYQKNKKDKNETNKNDDEVDCQAMGISKNEYSFCKEIDSEEPLRRECYSKSEEIYGNIAPFVLQDIQTCIENADIFITRNYSEYNSSEPRDYRFDRGFIYALSRVVTLVIHPALLTPTDIERCMQIAMTAKLNSGCLSRQVGAVVSDAAYNILSLGWNDAPCGVESCIRRNLHDIVSRKDESAYSEYELCDRRYREYIEVVADNSAKKWAKNTIAGMPIAFCFKNIYQDIIKQRDQTYTRALHGEERALTACGNDKARGGYLFTTSSPCELCAKKAKEAEIKKIYYIEQYPGISHAHVIDAGAMEQRAKYELFVGAVGSGYVKLYTPLMPYKDELEAYGFSPQDLHKGKYKGTAELGKEVCHADK